jgi:hypothetical protein
MRRETDIEVPTLEQLRRTSCWWWVNCREVRCLHRAPMALVPLGCRTRRVPRSSTAAGAGRRRAWMRA